MGGGVWKGGTGLVLDACASIQMAGLVLHGHAGSCTQILQTTNMTNSNSIEHGLNLNTGYSRLTRHGNSFCFIFTELDMSDASS